jgi:hypothetical protein
MEAAAGLGSQNNGIQGKNQCYDLPVCATRPLCGGSEAEREAGRKFGSFSEKDAKNAKYATEKQQ